MHMASITTASLGFSGVDLFVLLDERQLIVTYTAVYKYLDSDMYYFGSEAQQIGFKIKNNDLEGKVLNGHICGFTNI